MLDLEQKKISRKEALNDDHILSHAPLPNPPPRSPSPLFPFHKKAETCSQVLQLSSPIYLEAGNGS